MSLIGGVVIWKGQVRKRRILLLRCLVYCMLVVWTLGGLFTNLPYTLIVTEFLTCIKLGPSLEETLKGLFPIVFYSYILGDVEEIDRDRLCAGSVCCVDITGTVCA